MAPPRASRSASRSAARSADQARLRDYLEGEQTLLHLKCCAPKTLSVLIHDLSRPMSPTLEQALARRLGAREFTDFVPAETLLPAMMQRFGLDPAGADQDPASRSLRTVCNACPRIGACWLALRQGAARDECRALCPNAEAFASRAAAERPRADDAEGEGG